jgi:hypothetical protein
MDYRLITGMIAENPVEKNDFCRFQGCYLPEGKYLDWYGAVAYPGPLKAGN